MSSSRTRPSRPQPHSDSGRSDERPWVRQPRIERPLPAPTAPASKPERLAAARTPEPPKSSGTPPAPDAPNTLRQELPPGIPTATPDEAVRVNRALTQRGICSRRDADARISAGRVKVNGQVVALGSLIRPGDRLEVDGQVIPEAFTPRTFRFYKPKGITCTMDRRAPFNLADFLNCPFHIYPVGRLDHFSSGLLLLTNDGRIVNRILRAQFGHEKEYLVRLNHVATRELIQGLAEGIELDGRKTLPAQVTPLGPRTLRIILTEGRNRQIRRMLESFGYTASELTRVRVKNLTLGDLKPGEWRELLGSELEHFTQTVLNTGIESQWEEGEGEED